MTIFDYLVLLVLICSVIVSATQGFIKETFSLVNLLTALIIANTYSEVLVKMLPNFTFNEPLKLIVAFIILFFMTQFVTTLFTKALKALITVNNLSSVDSLFGSLFGLIRGTIIIFIAILLCGTTSIPQQLFWKKSVLSLHLEKAALIIKPYLPNKFRQNIHF